MTTITPLDMERWRATRIKTGVKTNTVNRDITAIRAALMRHHFASRLAMVAVDLNTIRELLGHSDYAMTLRYAHLAPEHRREAVEVLDRPRPHLKIVATN